jgi:hypothetical protein
LASAGVQEMDQDGEQHSRAKSKIVSAISFSVSIEITNVFRAESNTSVASTRMHKSDKTEWI